MFLLNLTLNSYYIEENKMWHGEAGWWKERFQVADIDHNGLLNFTELREYKYIIYHFFCNKIVQ